MAIPVLRRIMGYGIDVKKHPNRKWPPIIGYAGGE